MGVGQRLGVEWGQQVFYFPETEIVQQNNFLPTEFRSQLREKGRCWKINPCPLCVFFWNDVVPNGWKRCWYPVLLSDRPVGRTVRILNRFQQEVRCSKSHSLSALSGAETFYQFATKVRLGRKFKKLICKTFICRSASWREVETKFLDSARFEAVVRYQLWTLSSIHPGLNILSFTGLMVCQEFISVRASCSTSASVRHTKGSTQQFGVQEKGWGCAEVGYASLLTPAPSPGSTAPMFNHYRWANINFLPLCDSPAGLVPRWLGLKLSLPLQ